MQTDSVHFSTSGHMMLDEVVAEEESQVDSVRCSQCTLVFNSRGCLLKHLNQVHGLDVDAVLKQPEIDEESGGGGSETKLSETLNEHEFGCDGKSENQNDMEDLNQHTDTTVISTDEHKEDADMPTSKTTHALNSAKDLKTYKRPQQTITKYFSPASGSRENLSVKSSESAPVLESSEGTIFLQESPLNSSVNSSGVFKVTAKSMIDMCMVQGSNRFLLDDHLFSSDLRPTNPKEQFKENAPKIPGKRTNSEPAQNCPIKRVKSDKKQTQLPEQDDDHKPQPSSSSELAFEFSDDEEEKKVNGDAEISDVYFCKHCDYSDVTIRNMSTHYQNDHPYVRHNAAYVQDQSDQSATFRCLDCPVEFLNVTDLKSHYAENHPQAPNVFTNLQEISLVFKCFICPFICSELKLLKEHYKQIHPKHKVENPLLYCKYSKTAHQEESSQMDTCEKPSSPEKSEGISPKNTNTKNEEVRKSPQHPTSKAPDVVLYHCNSCNFSHKSVVVVHVHYQKSHPEESVTIDKIKRSAHVKSSVTPEKSVTSSEKPENPEKSVPDSPQTDGSVHVTSQVTPEKSVIVSEKSENTKKKTPDSPKADDSVHVAADATSQVTPEKSVTVTENVPDSPKTDDAELSQQKMVLSLVNLKHTSEASKGSSESPKMEEVKSTEEKNEATTPPIERRETTSAGTDGLRPNSPNELFYCQFCWYSSSKVRCVVAHHHLKHAVHGIISTEEILSYSAEVQKRKLLSKAEASASVASSDSRQVENHVAGASVMGTNPFACPENLFYCQKCNFGHPNIKGVLNHQAVTHKRFNSSRECIMKHTTLVRDEIVKSKSHTKELSFSTGLPLPLMNEGDENTFFCHFCNYRHHTVKHVLRHSFKRHPGFEVTVEQIHQYTAVVLKQTQTLHPKSTSTNQDVNKAPIQKKGKKRRKTKTLSKALSVSRAPPVRATQPQRTLQCHRCTYTCQYVNILRRHMWTMHRSNRSASEILRTCYKRGMVQTGYHCDLCVFSHKDATVVHQHFQEEHAERKHTLEYITTKLYVGPNTCPPRKKLKVELADDDDDDGSLSSQKVGQNDTKMYSCKACSFKGSSVSSMTHHYRSVHPWSVKDDGSVLNVITNKKPSVNSHVEDYSEKLDVCQSPVETVKSAASSPEAKGTFRCQFCSLEFHSERSLTIHCGMKHQETILENLNEQMEQQVRSQTRVHVFKCPYCTYVNSNYQGVLTHCQMKHPTFVSRADSLHVDKTKIKLSDDSFGNVLRLTGYMCKTCAQIYATQEKLNKHCEDDHNETAANTLKPSNTNSPIRPSSPSPDASLLCKSIHAQIKCEHCSYICRTKMVLSRHMRVHHRNASVSNVNDCAYKCELCSRFYLSKKRLGDHYARLHGKEAFLKYYIPVYKKAPEKLVLTSTNSASTEQPESSSDACKDIATMRENKILIYKCPVCPYVNNTQHGTLTHCQMVHTRLLVRREDLETEEVLESKMFLCKIGKRSNRKGYMCKKCPHICGSLKKLKIHRKRDHKQAVSEHSTEGETEEKPDHESQSSFTKTSPSKNKTVTENDPSQQPGSSSSTMFKCQYCPMCFYSLRSVSIHCGMKHQDAILEQSQTRVHVFRCPYCAYVNTYYQGVLTHCQMKHPAVIARADSFNVDEKHLQTLDDCLQRKVPGEILKFTGYICETCFQIYASLEEVNKHHETDHEAASDTINPAPTISDTDETEEGESNTHSAPTSSSSSSSSSNTSLLRRKVYAVIKCQYCKYSCTTKIALSRHLLFHHRNSSNGNECVHKCELCSKSYFGKTNLAIHYSKSHGKDAFLKYYVPVYRQAPKQSDKPKVTATTEGNKILVYKCPRCPYVNASHHGTLTHCQKTHPSLVARADELKTEEVLEINMLRCEMGKNSNRRGYMCKKCPQIHATSKELKIHRKLDHNVAESATSEQSAQVETEEKPDLTSESQDSVTEAASHTSALNITETDPSRELVSTGRPVLKQNKDQFLYQCHLCSYIGARRRYLHSHYKKTHKFDAFTTCKLLQKYNKRKRNKVSKSLEATSEKNTENKCKTCPNTTFDSSQLLIDHYSNFHGLAGKLNFIVLSQASKTTREVYKCVQCSKRLNGNRNLRLHLDRHRAWKKKKEMALKKKASLVVMEKPEPTTTDVWGQNEQPVLQTAEELTQENVAGSTGEENVTPVAAVESFTESTSPVSSPPKPTDPEQQELESREDKRTCKQCGRSFMSLKGLRSHERSHAALAAIKKLDNLPTSALKYNVNKYIIYKPGTLRPFLCGFCSYRTTVLVLWTSHFRKKHQDVIVNAAQTNHEDEDNIQEPGNLSEENNFPEPDEEAVMTENPLYLEPPDVQRQLNHYNLMARTGVSSRTNTQEIELPETTLLHCEFCNFNTGHLSSVRRHYLNRHGKKIFRCKDCSFFTGLRKSLEEHVKTGHSTFQSEPTHHKILRCPFCLYQTKNKNSMIDHIVLHREERVVPIEVRRSKLSRYLQGIVFRCHKCTFTSGSAENLRLHMMRHDDIRPYKCRLCYFDCTLLSDLEAHLSDKHQVMRNHELVGQVSLDQLETRVGQTPEEEEEQFSNLEPDNNEIEDAEIETLVRDGNDIVREIEAEKPSENNIKKKTTPQVKDACQKHDPTESEAQRMDDVVEINVEDETSPESSDAEREGKTNEHPIQPKLRSNESSSAIVTEKKEETAEGSSSTCVKTEALKLNIKALQLRTLNIEARVENNILHHILVMDDDGGVSKKNKTADQDRTVKTGQNRRTETEEDNSEANNTRGQESFKIERHLLTLQPNCSQFKISHSEILGGSLMNCKDKQAHVQKTGEDVTDGYGEIPELESEYLTDGGCEEEEENDRLNQKRDEADDRDDEEGRRKNEADDPQVNKSAFEATGGASEVLCSSVTKNKLYTCEFCGRNLLSSSELKRHILRHGI